MRIAVHSNDRIVHESKTEQKSKYLVVLQMRFLRPKFFFGSGTDNIASSSVATAAVLIVSYLAKHALCSSHSLKRMTETMGKKLENYFSISTECVSRHAAVVSQFHS